MMRENKKKAIFGLVAILLAGAVIGLQILKEDSPSEDTGPRWFNKFDLSFSEPPELNKPVELTLEVTPISFFMTTNDTIVEILLPEGFEHVSGDLEWRGTLRGNQTVQIKAIVKSVKTGDWKIRGRVTRDRDPAYGLWFGTSLYASISEKKVTVSRKRPPKAWRSIEEIIESMRSEAVRVE